MMAVSPARASTIISMSLDQLAQASSDIVQGRVVGQVSRWNDAHTQILTLTTVAVSHTFKGNAPSTLEVQQMGGTVGNMRTYVPGDVALQPHTEYVLFLEPQPGSSAYRMVGLTQGAYHVYSDALTQELRVILPLGHVLAENQMLGDGNPAGTVSLRGFHKYVATLVGAGIQIPHGLTMSVTVASAESRGAGRMHVYGRTSTDLFPNRNLVIPAGTAVEGEAVLAGGNWTIHWDEVSVRGVHAPISATSQEVQGSLRGKSMLVNVR
jgi:hypothetical protein